MHMNNLQGKECAGDYLFLPASEVKTVSVLGSTSELEQLWVIGLHAYVDYLFKFDIAWVIF